MSQPLLSQFFANKNLIDIFIFFLLHPREDSYLAQIVDSTGKALIQVQRTLKRLTAAGLILTTKRHKKTYYRPDLNHVAYDDIRNLVIKAKIFSEQFEDIVNSLKKKVSYGFIYGSVAKGTNSPLSDIDIFLVGNLELSDASSFMFKLGRELMQEVNVVIFSPHDLKTKIKNGNSFVANVLKEPKIWLFGDKSEFEKFSQ